MKNFTYIICFLMGSVWATKSQEIIDWVGDFEPSRTNVVSCLIVHAQNNQSEQIVSLLEQNWVYLHFWAYTSELSFQAFQDWAIVNRQAYWQLIENYNYLGQSSCFWWLFGVAASDDKFLSELIDSFSVERLQELVQKYFAEVKQDIESAISAGKDLQDEEWIIPFQALLKYKPEVFLWLLAQEPLFRGIWLSVNLLLKWSKLSSETLYDWASNHWSEFKDNIKLCSCRYSPWYGNLWEVLIPASPQWLAKHLNLIVEMINQDLKLIAYGRALSDFIKQHPHFFVSLLLQDPNLLNYLFENDRPIYCPGATSTYQSVLRVVLEQNLKLYVQLRQAYRRVQQKNISAKQAWQEINHEHLTKKPKRKFGFVSKIIFDCSLPYLQTWES